MRVSFEEPTEYISNADKRIYVWRNEAVDQSKSNAYKVDGTSKARDNRNAFRDVDDYSKGGYTISLSDDLQYRSSKSTSDEDRDASDWDRQTTDRIQRILLWERLGG